jgi:hypothetical protein
MKTHFIFLLFVSSFCTAQIITFPDPNFKAFLLGADSINQRACVRNQFGGCTNGPIDTNGNGEIEVAEAQEVINLRYANTSLVITDVTGIAYFTNLKLLNWSFTNISSLNVSTLVHLEILSVSFNPLLASITLGELPELEFLAFQNCMVSSIDVSQLPKLRRFLLRNNQISTLDVSQNPLLEIVYCSNNLIATLDFTHNPVFYDLGCRNNPNLTSIKIKNGRTQLFGAGTFYNECWNNVPNLNYICADANEIPALQSFLSGCGVTQPITIDSSCVLGVETFEANRLVVYPNPAQEVLYVTVVAPTEYAVYNTLGQVLQKGSIENATEGIDVKVLPAGSYILSLRAATGAVERLQFVKQ